MKSDCRQADRKRNGNQGDSNCWMQHAAIVHRLEKRGVQGAHLIAVASSGNGCKELVRTARQNVQEDVGMEAGHHVYKQHADMKQRRHGDGGVG